MPLLFLLCFSGIIQCKLLLLKVQCLDNNRWRYVTSATIYELKEKIILISHPFIIKYNDSKLCVIHIHNYLKYVLQILLMHFFPFSQRNSLVL